MCIEPLPIRRSPRLESYDYSSPGAYFVTLCSHGHKCIFGRVLHDRVEHSQLGCTVRDTWAGLASFCPGVCLDEFVIMPNHLHAIVFLDADNQSHEDAHGSPKVRRANQSLPSLIRRFKTLTNTTAIQEARSHGGSERIGSLWQRSYYDHVVRSDESLLRIREYICSNPLRWALDRQNPEFDPVALRPFDTDHEEWMI